MGEDLPGRLAFQIQPNQGGRGPADGIAAAPAPVELRLGHSGSASRPAEAAQVTAGAAPSPGDPAPTVMVAEQHPMARRARQREFERAGFSVFSIPDEGELVRWLLQVPPDVLVLDRRLAGPGGEVVHWMREDPQLRRAACYVLDLVPSPREREVFLEAGADWYIDKNALVNPLPSVVRAGLDPTTLWPPPATRQAPRVRVAQTVDFLHGRRMATGETLNISQSGMFLRVSSALDVGAQLLLSFSLPGHRRWECFAQVAWVRRPDDEHPYPPGMGLQFLEMEADASAALAAFLATQPTPASAAGA